MKRKASDQDPHVGSHPIPNHFNLHHTTPRLQLLSPFYSGIIPAEIRNLIFSYVLTPTPIPDTDYSPDTNYTRPGFTCRTQLHVALLRTCRRIYSETYHLPPTSIPHVFWHERHPPSTGDSRAEHTYFLRLPPFQRALVNSIHLHTQLYWLQDSFAPLTLKLPLPNLTSLKITIRRGDWWWNEVNEALAINPYRGDADVSQMRQDMAACQRGEVLNWATGKWGFAFANLPHLDLLEMEFETSEDKRAELKKIVEWARTWEFPMAERGVLSTRKSPGARAAAHSQRAGPGDVRTWGWRGGRIHWSDVCPYCVDDFCRNDPGGMSGDKCRERKELRDMGQGPMLVVMEVQWKLTSRSEGE